MSVIMITVGAFIAPWTAASEISPCDDENQKTHFANILLLVEGTVLAWSHLLCAACEGVMLSFWSTAALADGEMDLGGEHKGECLVWGYWCER